MPIGSQQHCLRNIEQSKFRTLFLPFFLGNAKLLPLNIIHVYLEFLQNCVVPLKWLCSHAFSALIESPVFKVLRGKRPQESDALKVFQAINCSKSCLQSPSVAEVFCHLEEFAGIENGKLTPVRLPLPFQIPIIRPAKFHAILMLLDTITSVIRIVRRFRIRNPFSAEDIALLQPLRTRVLRLKFNAAFNTRLFSQIFWRGKISTGVFCFLLWGIMLNFNNVFSTKSFRLIYWSVNTRIFIFFRVICASERVVKREDGEKD
nr:hypothetical protein CDL12_17499 [Ipomoea batatas]